MTLTTTMVARAPYLVAEACAATESSCPGTHDCCGKGEGCCLGFHNNTDGVREAVSMCCPLGEDAVCCEEGSCCPYDNECDGDFCVDPAGNRTPKAHTQISRKSDNAATSTCVDSNSLHEEVRKELENSADANKAIADRELVADEGKLMCPPFCGNGGSQVPREDVGQWGNAEDNKHRLGAAGEVGVTLPLGMDETAEQQREREKQEIMNELNSLKQELATLLAIPETEHLQIADKMELMESLMQLLQGFSEDYESDVRTDLDSLQALALGLAELKAKLGADVLGKDGISAISRLEAVVVLLTSFLANNPDSDLALHAQKELTGIFDKIREARAKTKCQRASINEPAGPDCETTQMSLTAMPLRDVDDEDKYDPVLQQQFGTNFPGGKEPARVQDPPVWPKEVDDDWTPDS